MNYISSFKTASAIITWLFREMSEISLIPFSFISHDFLTSPLFPNPNRAVFYLHIKKMLIRAARTTGNRTKTNFDLVLIIRQSILLFCHSQTSPFVPLARKQVKYMLTQQDLNTLIISHTHSMNNRTHTKNKH